MIRIDKAYVANPDGTGYWTLLVNGEFHNLEWQYDNEEDMEIAAEELLLELEAKELEPNEDFGYDTWKEYYDAACEPTD